MAADDAAARARKSAACLIIVERGWTTGVWSAVGGDDAKVIIMSGCCAGMVLQWLGRFSTTLCCMYLMTK
jgi:hypothetical protein